MKEKKENLFDRIMSIDEARFSALIFSFLLFSIMGAVIAWYKDDISPNLLTAIITVGSLVAGTSGFKMWVDSKNKKI